MQTSTGAGQPPLPTIHGYETPVPLIAGRQQDLAKLQAAIAEVGRAGQAIIVSGEAGIGKTTIAAHTVEMAREAGFLVLTCIAVEREQSVGYINLHQLLQPILPNLQLLPARQRATLEAIFGMGDTDATPASLNPLLVHTATLALLEEASAERPVLLLVEDLHWLDRSSADVVAFLARRLHNIRVVLIATLRDGSATSVDWTHPPVEHLPLAPLSPAESEQVLDESPVPLSRTARKRIVREARGNPLALHELAAELQQRGLLDDADVIPRLPMSRRLERGFLQQVQRLPEPTQRFLLLAAAAEDAPLSDVVTAARELDLSPRDLAPAEDDGIVRVLAEDVRFRHPLARSAVYSAAPLSARLAVHRALAVALGAHRGAWHLAAATPDRDESVARALTGVAADAARHGAQAEASVAYERAAALSVDPSARLHRLVEAAETARLAGLPSASGLAAAARPLLNDPTTEPELAVRSAITRWRLSASNGRWEARIQDLVKIAEQLAGPSGQDHGPVRIHALAAAAAGVYVLQPEGDLRARVRDALDAIPSGNEVDAQLQVARVLADPLRHAPHWRGRLPELAGSVPAPNRLASAAEAIQDLTSASALWNIASELTSRAGETSEECLTLHGQALIRVLTGDLTGALASAELAQRLSEDAGLFIIHSAALLVAAQAHVWSGDLTAAASELERAQQIAGSAPVGRTAAELHWAAGLLALAEQRHWDAWVRLRQVACHSVVAAWAIADLTEAAIRTGKVAELREILAQLDRDNDVYVSPHLTMLLQRSFALIAEGPAAEDAYRAAIAAGASSGAPLELARTRLAYGAWLRRQRRTSDALEPLTEALNAFSAAGARLLADRAGAELRATGASSVSRPKRLNDPATVLTPQELQIAQLAASGLTNKEIADQIYLSHRTVSSHLYRIFPKLGLTSRAQLRDALGR